MSTFFKPARVQAMDPADFSTNKFDNSYIPELKDYLKGSGKIYSAKIPKLTNYFQINSVKNEHKVTFTDGFTGKNGEDYYYCWRMSASDYFEVASTNYYYCAARNDHGIVAFNHSIYSKTSKSSYDEYKDDVWDFKDGKGGYYIALGTKRVFNIFTGVLNYKNTLQAEYMWYLSASGAGPDWRSGFQKRDCEYLATNGSVKKLDVSFFQTCFFPDGGRFKVPVKFEDGHSTITIDAQTVFKNHPEARRPRITFTMKKVISGRGMGQADNNYFYFIATKPSIPNLAIKVINCSTDNAIVATDKLASINDDTGVGNSVLDLKEARVIIDQKSLWDNLINKFYNNGPYPVGTCPDVKNINVDKVEASGAEVVDRNEGDPSNDGCSFDIGNPMESAIKMIQCTVIKGLLDLLKIVADWLTDASGMTYNKPTSSPAFAALGIQKAHAENNDPTKGNQQFTSDPSNPLSRQLNLRTDKSDRGSLAQVAVDIWGSLLAFIDAFLAFALLFLAIANMFHININTYEVKKVLPGLVIGVFTANISWFICIALMDLANMATVALAHGYPVEVVKDLMQGLIGSTNGTVTNLASIDFAKMGFGEFLLDVVIILVYIVMFFVLAVLLWVRGIFLMILFAVSSLAFLASGFPMTQQYFKQWWSEFSKWVFMLPIMFFILWIAKAVVSSGDWSFYKVVITAALTWAAVKVPLSAGGIAAGTMGKLKGYGNRAQGLALNGAKYGAVGAGRGLDRLAGGRLTQPARQFRAWKAQKEEEGKKRQELYDAQATDRAKWFKTRNKGYAVRQLHNKRVAEQRKFFKDVEMDHTDLSQVLVQNQGNNALPARQMREAAMLELMETWPSDVIKKNVTEAADGKLVRGMGFKDAAEYQTLVGDEIKAGRRGQALMNLATRAHNADLSKMDVKYQDASGMAAKIESLFYKKGHMDKTSLVKSDGKGGREFRNFADHVEEAMGNAGRASSSKLASDMPADAFVMYKGKDAAGNEIWDDTEYYRHLRAADPASDQGMLLQNMANYYKGMNAEQKKAFRELERRGVVVIPTTQRGGGTSGGPRGGGTTRGRPGGGGGGRGGPRRGPRGGRGARRPGGGRRP